MNSNNLRKELVNKELPKNKEIRILDLGCKEGEITSYIYNKGYLQIKGVDINKESIKKAKEKYRKINFEVKDALRIDYRKYDFILALGIFEYIPKIKKLLHKIEEEMLPGAEILFSVPNVCSLSKRVRCLVGINPNRDPPGISYSFTFKQIKDMIKDLKFKDKKIISFKNDKISNINIPVKRNLSRAIIVKMLK